MRTRLATTVRCAALAAAAFALLHAQATFSVEAAEEADERTTVEFARDIASRQSALFRRLARVGLGRLRLEVRERIILSGSPASDLMSPARFDAAAHGFCSFAADLAARADAGVEQFRSRVQTRLKDASDTTLPPTLLAGNRHGIAERLCASLERTYQSALRRGARRCARLTRASGAATAFARLRLDRPVILPAIPPAEQSEDPPKDPPEPAESAGVRLCAVAAFAPAGKPEGAMIWAAGVTTKGVTNVRLSIVDDHAAWDPYPRVVATAPLDDAAPRRHVFVQRLDAGRFTNVTLRDLGLPAGRNIVVRADAYELAAGDGTDVATSSLVVGVPSRQPSGDAPPALSKPSDTTDATPLELSVRSAPATLNAARQAVFVVTGHTGRFVFTTLEAGESRGKPLDLAIALFGPDADPGAPPVEAVRFDDDSGARRNARLVADLAGDAEYLLVVSRWQGDKATFTVSFEPAP